MTSIHMDTNPQSQTNGTNGLGQSQLPSNFDQVERVRQRMDGLRKHHNDSSDIYNRTQPIINEQIRDETMKYLKSGQVNGTKTKSQKPRATKRQRNTAANNNNNNSNSIETVNGVVNPVAVAQSTNPVVTSTTNGIPPQPQQIQHAVPSSQGIVQQGQHMQQITLYPPRIQQQPMHMQQHPQHQVQSQQPQQQQHFKYQPTSNNIYQPQQTMQTQQHQYQAPQPQQVYPQQQQIRPSSHMHPQQIEQSHFMTQQASRPPPPPQQQQSQRFGQHPNHHHPSHQHQHHMHHQQGHFNYATFTSLPNDLDLNLQAGLECDIDSLIKHEMSVEGQLDFNHDLLLKLDNHYLPPMNHVGGSQQLANELRLNRS